MRLPVGILFIFHTAAVAAQLFRLLFIGINGFPVIFFRIIHCLIQQINWRMKNDAGFVRKRPNLLYFQSLKNHIMQLGAFSISLSVKDIQASKQFYEKLGFSVFGGNIDQGWLIMKNGNALIGLFQGMFQGNLLTFNPGWDENAQLLPVFDDVRVIQQHLKGEGVSLSSEADETTTGPASFVVTDPDGNTILVDQHV
jgi:catechol 2,3-dioxygenase-like lactoylglutathione lyase family enzyme